MAVDGWIWKVGNRLSGCYFQGLWCRQISDNFRINISFCLWWIQMERTLNPHVCVCFCQGLWVRLVWQHIPARNWMMTGNLSHKHDGLPKMRWGDPVGRVCYASCSCCFPFFEGTAIMVGTVKALRIHRWKLIMLLKMVRPLFRNFQNKSTGIRTGIHP